MKPSTIATSASSHSRVNTERTRPPRTTRSAGSSPRATARRRARALIARTITGSSFRQGRSARPGSGSARRREGALAPATSRRASQAGPDPSSARPATASPPRQTSQMRERSRRSRGSASGSPSTTSRSATAGPAGSLRRPSRPSARAGLRGRRDDRRLLRGSPPSIMRTSSVALAPGGPLSKPIASVTPASVPRPSVRYASSSCRFAWSTSAGGEVLA